MTWSILATDPDSGERAVCVASAFLGVGGQVIYSDDHGTVVVCQSQPSLGVVRAIFDLASRHCDPTVLERSITVPRTCQVHCITQTGILYHVTGTACLQIAHYKSSPNVSVAGNTLASSAVVEITHDHFIYSCSSGNLHDRLVEAMLEGQAVGGDRRGQQSAALILWDHKMRKLLDLRVDDNPTALSHLRDILKKAEGAYSRLIEKCLAEADRGS